MKNQSPPIRRTRLGRRMLSALAVCAGLLSLAPATHAAPASGNILILNADKGTNGLGELMVVAPSTAPGGAAVTVLSDFGNSAQGPLGSSPQSITVIPGAVLGLTKPVIIVADPTAGTGQNGLLFSIDPETGNRTKLTDFGTTTKGPLGRNPVSVALDANVLGLGNRLIVLDDHAGASKEGLVFAVNPTTGIRTVISDLGDGASPTLDALDATQVAVMPNLAGLPGATILLVDAVGGTATQDQFGFPVNGGSLLSIDSSGKRTLLSDFGNAAQGPKGVHPLGAIASPNLLGLGSQLLVIDELGGTNHHGALFSVAANGARTLVSDFGLASQGPLGQDPSNMAVKQTCVLVACTNTLYVADRSAGGNGGLGYGMIFQVNPDGSRTIAANFNPRAAKFQFNGALPGMAVYP